MKFGSTSHRQPPARLAFRSLHRRSQRRRQLAEACGSTPSCFASSSNGDGFLPRPSSSPRPWLPAPASPGRHLGHGCAAPTIRCTWPRTDQRGPRVQGGAVIILGSLHRLSAPTTPRVSRCRWSPLARSRRASRSCACAGRAAFFVPAASTTPSRNGRFARGRPRSGAAAVDAPACRGRAPGAGPDADASWARRARAFQRDRLTDIYKEGGPDIRAGARGRSECAFVFGPPRTRAEPRGLRPARHGGVIGTTGAPPLAIQSPCRPTRSSHAGEPGPRVA